MSEKFTAMAVWRTRASPAAGGGSPTSSQRIASGPPWAWMRMAFIGVQRPGWPASSRTIVSAPRASTDASSSQSSRATRWEEGISVRLALRPDIALTGRPRCDGALTLGTGSEMLAFAPSYGLLSYSARDQSGHGVGLLARPAVHQIVMSSALTYRPSPRIWTAVNF